jgi:dCTP deaminase
MEEFPEGVLNSDQLRALHDVRAILGVRSLDKKVCSGSALNLHLGRSGWTLKGGSIKQIAGSRSETVAEICGKYGAAFELTEEGTVLKQGSVVVIKLEEELDFSQYPWLHGEATGKSSIGRLDILTRLLANSCPEYERVPNGYRGPLFVEIAPISFDIRLYPGLSLNQLRVHCGPRSPLTSLIGRRLLFRSDDGQQFCAAAQEDKTLSLDISPREGSKLTAYRLKEAQILPLFDFKDKGKIDAKRYFERIDGDSDALTIEVNRFYILRSIERLRLPADIAVTGMAYSENLGELRIHYAGFAHPWFGMEREDEKTGTPLIFEVRAHSFPVLLRHEEVFATIRFYKMSKEIPAQDKEKEPDDYTNQELKLSNYFAKDSMP